MALDLSAVQAKIERAYEHLETLNGEIESWVRRYPYGLRHDKEDEGRKHVGFLEIYRKPDNVRFGLLVGECVHNMRSALDYLIRAVAEDTLSEPDLLEVEGLLAFPICSEPIYWEKAIKRKRLQGVGDKARAAIERRQPYHAPDPTLNPFFILQDLDDRDKHRILHTFVAAPEPEEFRFIPELPGPNEIRVFPPPYEDGAQIFEARTADPSPDVQVQCQLVIQIRIREARVPEEVRVLLPSMGQMIQRVVADVAKAHAADVAAATQGALL